MKFLGGPANRGVGAGCGSIGRRGAGFALPIEFAWLALAAALASAPAAAQEAVAPAAPAPPPLEQTRTAPWRLSVTPYLWATSLNGDVGVGRTEADVDASFSDILENLNVAAMLEVELWKGRFGLLSNTVYAQLEDDSASAQDRLRIDATSNILIQGLGGAYRVGTWQLAEFEQAGPLTVAVEPYAGIRYTYLNLELKGQLDLPILGVEAQRTAEGDKQWVDPVVGLRAIWTLGERLSLAAAGDIGGTSTNSQYSWQATGLVGYRFGLFGENDANLVAGYRALHQKYEDGDGRSAFAWDVTIHGPVAGLTIAF